MTSIHFYTSYTTDFMYVLETKRPLEDVQEDFSNFAQTIAWASSAFVQ